MRPRATADAGSAPKSYTRISFSYPPVTSVRPSPPGPKATVRTMCECGRQASSSPETASKTRAEKSAEAVAHRSASLSKEQPQTAPLWPTKVPIQSPVRPLRSMGWPSLEAEVRKTPSGVGELFC